VIDYLLSEWEQRKAEADGAELVEGLLVGEAAEKSTKVTVGKSTEASPSVSP